MAQVKVKGMSCGHCTASVTQALEALDGVTNVNVTLETGIAQYDEEKPVDPQTVKDAITKVGFEVEE